MVLIEITLYQNASATLLLDVNTADGSAVLIGLMGVGVTPSLATDPLTGAVYVATGAGNPVLHTVNPANGATMLVGGTGLGFASVAGVRAGKLFHVTIEAVSADEAGEQAEQMSARLLANPVIETYAYEIAEAARE